jgi:hypothetical protein
VPGSQVTVDATANEIWARFRENELGAQAQYAGATLRVTGTVNGVELQSSDRPVVLLATPNKDFPLRAEMNPDAGAKAATLKEGDNRTFDCRGIAQLAGSPMLLNCDL